MGSASASFNEPGKHQLEKTHYRNGLRVLEVKSGSPAEAAGIQKEDILVGLDKWEVTTGINIDWIMKQAAGSEIQNQIRYDIVRKRKGQSDFLPIPAKVERPVPSDSPDDK